MIAGKAWPRLDGADPINRGLVAFWPLAQQAGGMALDIAPRERNGALNNFGSTAWGTTQQGRALTFNGSNTFINVGSRPINNLPSGSFVISFRPNAGGGVLYYEDGGGKNNFALDCPSPGSSALAFYIGSNTLRNSTTRTWAASTWYDLVITWGTEIRVYINGVLDTTIAAAVGTDNAVGDNDQFGRYSFGGGVTGAYTPATIGRTRIYNRVLTPGEVARLARDQWAGTARRGLRSVANVTPLDPITGTLTATLAAATLSATGVLPITGELAKALDSATLTALGLNANPVVQSGAGGRRRKGARRIYLPEPDEPAVVLPPSLARMLKREPFADEDEEDAWFLLG